MSGSVNCSARRAKGKTLIEDYQLRQREYLLQISRAMSARLDLPSLLRLILNSAVDMLGSEVGLIALRGQDDLLKVSASIGIPAGLLHFFEPLWTDLPLLQSRAELPHWRIPDLYSRLGLVAHAVGIALRQVVSLPLMLEDNIEGIIYVFRTQDNAFSANDRQILASFADQAAIAVRNARLYQQISAEKRRLDAIIADSADGILILDGRYRVQVINKSLARLTGWDMDNARGRLCYEILDLKDRQGRPLPHAACPFLPESNDQPAYQEGHLHRPQSKMITVGVTCSPLYDEEGQLLNIICNVHDITRFREAEEMKSTFISVISHELKTPVALIKGYAGTLRREDAHWDDKTLREGLNIIEEESDKLAALIDNLLDASRIQAGALKLEMSDVAIPKLAQKAVTRFQTQTSRHSFKVEFAPDFPIVLGDPERLEAVFYNLLTNAIKYSPQGGEIRVGGQFDDREVVVYVVDQGIGITGEDQEYLFQPFSRVDSGLSRRTPGAGLGLYLCRAIIEAHGGRIWIESVPGQGSTFRFSLPRGDG
jgi:PAS domain S-box-containing protein